MWDQGWKQNKNIWVESDISVSLHGQKRIIISLCDVVAFTMNQNYKTKIYKPGKDDGRIPIP